MAEHIVFLVHGMGAYVGADGRVETDWHQNLAEALIRTAVDQRSVDLDVDRLRRDVEFVPVVYDTTFHELARSWEQNAETLQQFQQFGPLADVFAGAGELEDNFLWTHAADVLMYFASSVVRRAVIEQVKAQLLDRLAGDSITRWSVIAHSLGSAVAHDAVDDFVREYHVERAASWYTPPQMLAMIANVSRVLQQPGRSVYASHACPKADGCRAFLTADHDYDPFTWARPFRPNGGAWETARDPFGAFRYFDPTSLSHIQLPDDLDPDDAVDAPLAFLRKNNPHDVEHYLANPRVHLPILAWLSGRWVTNARINEAAVVYRAQRRCAASDAIREAMTEKVHEAIGLADDEDLTVETLFGRLQALVEKWRL